MTDHIEEPTEPRLQFRLLGPVEVRNAAGDVVDVGGSKPRLVLVHLLLNPKRVVATDVLVDALWGEDAPPTARRSLQSHVARLRAALGGDDGPLKSSTPGYVLVVDDDQVDLWRSEALVRQARGVLESDPRRAQQLVRQARVEWLGDPLADLAFHDPLVPQRRRLTQIWLDLVELEVDAQLASGDNAGAVERLESLVLERPEHEPFWARLVTAYYRLGRQRDALEAFKRARHALLDELGIDPSPELQRLEVAILGQAADLDDVRAQPCPYKGLASYQLDDADRFCGRDDLVAELVEAVRTAPFVVVVGSSGAGKSSALRAGLLKAIESRQLDGLRDATLITPGASPMRSIYQVPRSADVVIVDQFEELFTLTDDEATQREFVRVLLARLGDGLARVVISLRADFYGNCTKLPELASLLAKRQVVVGPLTERELRTVIARPAEQTGLVVHADLVDAIVSEAGDRAGALPLVSHALVETWHRRVDGHLTLAAYRDAGSIAAAIARTAEKVYASFRSAQQGQTERLFLRLVEPGEGAEHARRKVTDEQLRGSSIDREVIDVLIEARLLTAGSDGVEIAHEALIQAWPRLSSWIDDDRDGIRMHRHLTSAASAWAELGRDEGELYRGARLSSALSWIAHSEPDLSDVERQFIAASAELSEGQLRQQQRTNRRLRVLLGVSLIAVIAAAAGSVLAVNQANDADRRRAEAEAQALVATIRSESDMPPSVVLQLAIEADRRASTPTTRGLLLDALNEDVGFVALGEVDALMTGDAPISANGGVLVAIDDNVFGVVLDAASLELRTRNLRPAPSVVVDTGTRLLGVTGPTLETVDLETNEKLGPPPDVTGRPTKFALSPEGTTLAAASAVDGAVEHDTLAVFDVVSGEQRVAMADTGRASLRNVTFSPDGRYVLAVVGETGAGAWDAATGREEFARSPSASDSSVAIERVAMSPSADLIALGREDGQVEMWTLDEGSTWDVLGVGSPHEGPITWLDFDAEGSRMVSTSRDGRAVVWDTATGAVLNSADGGGSITYFLPGSATTLVNVDARGPAQKWELERAGGLVTTVPGVNIGASATVDGGLVLVADDAGVTVHDPAGGPPREVPLDTSDASPLGVAASADGARLVIVYDDGRVEVRDTASGDLVISPTLAPIGDEIMLAIDGDGSRIAVQTSRQVIHIFDDNGTVEPIGLSLLRSHLQALDLSDDGSGLVISTVDGEAVWYDLEGIGAAAIAESPTGYDAHFVTDDLIAVVGSGGAQLINPRSRQSTQHFDVGDDADRVAVDPSGRLLATTDQRGLIQLWDAEQVVRIGEPLHVVDSPSSPIRFSADGNYLLVSGSEQTAWINVRTADWPRVACERGIDEFSSSNRAPLPGAPDLSETCP